MTFQKPRYFLCHYGVTRTWIKFHALVKEWVWIRLNITARLGTGMECEGLKVRANKLLLACYKHFYDKMPEAERRLVRKRGKVRLRPESYIAALKWLLNRENITGDEYNEAINHEYKAGRINGRAHKKACKVYEALTAHKRQGKYNKLV